MTYSQKEVLVGQKHIGKKNTHYHNNNYRMILADKHALSDYSMLWNHHLPDPSSASAPSLFQYLMQRL
ncbi:MAG: hypothetical protein OQK73_12435 [Gammaproteobacteria bacterium]|nr:hypothetical protein [Gammaproteobacteria bacterium]